MPQKCGGVLLSALPKDTASKLAGLFSTLSLYYAERQAESCEYHFLKSFGMTRLGMTGMVSSNSSEYMFA